MFVDYTCYKTTSPKKVRLIIVNEIQELVEFKDEETRQQIVNTFKMISEEAQVAFVLVGMPYSTLLTEESQWSSRLLSKVPILLSII